MFGKIHPLVMCPSVVLDPNYHSISSHGHLLQPQSCHRYDFLGTYFGTDLILFELFKLYFHLGLITTLYALCVHMTYVYFFYMFHSSHDHMAKRSHYRIMIFLLTFGVLFYGRILTLIFFYVFHNPTTPILPIYVEQRRPHLEKDTTRSRGMVIRQISAVPGRTRITPD